MYQVAFDNWVEPVQPKKPSSRMHAALRPRIENQMEPIHRFLIRLVGPEQAPDLMQETFLRAYQRMRLAPPDPSLVAPWLFRIARNLAIDFFRGKRKTTALATSDTVAAPPSAEPSTRVEHAEQQRQVEQLIRDVPQPFRTAFLLCAIEGFSYEQAAAIEGCSPKTISSRLARARARLRILIQHSQQTKEAPR